MKYLDIGYRFIGGQLLGDSGAVENRANGRILAARRPSVAQPIAAAQRPRLAMRWFATADGLRMRWVIQEHCDES
jgi:hypothetical protein